MKTKNRQALLYDDNCPLCAAYTTAFVKAGLLQKENRIAFSSINIRQFPLDTNRARHEIPLVDLETGEVKYGVDALAEILNQKLPFIKPVLSIRWVHWLFKKLYSFISYNRKIIVAKPSFAKGCFDCSPDYSFKHRVALAFFTSVLAGLMLLQLAGLYISSAYNPWFLAWFIIPLSLIFRKTKQQAADILVHSGITMLLSTIFLFFSLKIFSWLFTFSWPVMACSILVSAIIFFHQLKRRVLFHNNEYAACNSA
ncbi:MAG: DCC1-like thiol-disulfide oxidoreductase family protein [Bacteroidota bacterium]